MYVHAWSAFSYVATCMYFTSVVAQGISTTMSATPTESKFHCELRNFIKVRKQGTAINYNVILAFGPCFLRIDLCYEKYTVQFLEIDFVIYICVCALCPLPGLLIAIHIN